MWRGLSGEIIYLGPARGQGEVNELRVVSRRAEIRKAEKKISRTFTTPREDSQ